MSDPIFRRRPIPHPNPRRHEKITIFIRNCNSRFSLILIYFSIILILFYALLPAGDVDGGGRG